MLRTAQSLPPSGLSTLGSDPARYQTEPPACYRASWQLPGRDSHPLATTSLCSDQVTPSTTSESLGTRRVGGRRPVPRGRSRLVPVSSRRHLEPCVRFSRTRLTDVLHRRHSAVPVEGRPWPPGRAS